MNYHDPKQGILDVDSENLKMKVLDLMPSGVTIADPDGVFIYVNDAAGEMLGYSDPQQLINLGWQVLYEPKAIGLYASEVFPKLQANKKWDGVVEMVRKDGSKLNVHAFLSKLPSDHFCCVFYDVTKTVQLEDRLNEFHRSVDNAMDGVALLDAEGKYYYLNTQHQKLFGYDSDQELLGKTFHIFYNEPEIKRIERDIFPLLIRDGSWHGETLGKKKDGSPIEQELTLSTQSNGGLICIMRDITDRKKSEHRLQKLAAVVQNTDNLVFFTDIHHKITWMNEAALRALPRQVEIAKDYEACDYLMLNGYLAEDVSLLPSVNNNQQKNISQRIEFKVKNEITGNWLYARVNPLYENEVLTSFIYLFVDITTIKQAEESYIRSWAKEKRINELTSGFANIVSHEFKTPLAGLQSSIDLINLYCERDKTIGVDQLLFQVGQIQENINRMSSLIELILSSGRVNDGKIDYKPEDYDLVQLVNEIIDHVNPAEPEKIATLKVEGENRKIFGDHRLMRQAIQNLLSNAYKFSMKSSKAPLIKIIFGDGYADIEITDYGIGIPKEYQSRIFQTFVRADNAENISGTGLGLSISKQFVEINGGEITFESREGEGTTMFIHLKN